MCGETRGHITQCISIKLFYIKIQATTNFPYSCYMEVVMVVGTHRDTDEITKKKLKNLITQHVVNVIIRYLQHVSYVRCCTLSYLGMPPLARLFYFYTCTAHTHLHILLYIFIRVINLCLLSLEIKEPKNYTYIKPSIEYKPGMYTRIK